MCANIPRHCHCLSSTALPLPVLSSAFLFWGGVKGRCKLVAEGVGMMRKSESEEGGRKGGRERETEGGRQREIVCFCAYVREGGRQRKRGTRRRPHASLS